MDTIDRKDTFGELLASAVYLIGIDQVVDVFTCFDLFLFNLLSEALISHQEDIADLFCGQRAEGIAFGKGFFGMRECLGDGSGFFELLGLEVV